jgi:dTDP-4-amino-4,6-dideoxygalactose transaminase
VPMHLQECFAYLGHSAGAFPESEGAAKETLALPVHPELSEEQARYVVECIGEFFATNPSVGGNLTGAAASSRAGRS